MDYVIIFKKQGGGIGVIHPAPKAFAGLKGKKLTAALEKMAQKSVSNGAVWHIAKTKDLPSDRTYRDAWVYDESAGTVSLDNEKLPEIENRIINKKRQKDYPKIGDQLDAIWKILNQLRLDGVQLPQDGDDMLGKILKVKKDYPKPKKK